MATGISSTWPFMHNNKSTRRAYLQHTLHKYKFNRYLPLLSTKSTSSQPKEDAVDQLTMWIVVRKICEIFPQINSATKIDMWINVSP